MKVNYIEDIIIVDDIFTGEEIKDLQDWGYNLNNYKLISDVGGRIFTFCSYAEPTNDAVEFVLERFKSKFNFELPDWNRILVNLFKQNDFCDTHQDSLHPFGLSILVYFNTQWELHWGGETYFTKEKDPNFTISVLPKPGRVVITPTYLYHGSRPSTFLTESKGRLTMVFQYTGDPNNNEKEFFIEDILKSFMENSDA